VREHLKSRYLVELLESGVAMLSSPMQTAGISCTFIPLTQSTAVSDEIATPRFLRRCTHLPWGEYHVLERC
jgi:hypothetical protein